LPTQNNASSHNKKLSNNRNQYTADDQERVVTRRKRHVKNPTKIEGFVQPKKQNNNSQAKPIEKAFSNNAELVIRDTIDGNKGDIQVSVLEDGILVEHMVNLALNKSITGNIYFGVVKNILDTMNVAFVNISTGKNAVLYSDGINLDSKLAGSDTNKSNGETERLKISDTLKEGDKVLVQVTKDPLLHKGARLTTQISLAGKYVYFLPNGNSNIGISMNINKAKKAHLKKIVKTILPVGSSAILRSSASWAKDDEIINDIASLLSEWETIQKKIDNVKQVPVLIKQNPNLGVRAIRDIVDNNYKKITVSGDKEYQTVKTYMEKVAPKQLELLEKWTKDTDVFVEKQIDVQIAKAMNRKIMLPSGGSLVFDRTEAMTVVDVNTGKFVGDGEQDLESLVTENNLEAAEELIRQLRLKDIGGIIVVDFIDMIKKENQKKVLDRIVECLTHDRTKYQVSDITQMGLVQITRKRIGTGLIEAFSTVCEHCEGRGYMIQNQPVERINSALGDFDNSNNDHSKDKQIDVPEVKVVGGTKSKPNSDAMKVLTEIAAAKIDK
jgi:ribonuclease E